MSKQLIDAIIESKSEHDLLLLMARISEDCGYMASLLVPFEFLHYGAHGEQARRSGYLELSSLFWLAWQMNDTFSMHSKDALISREEIKGKALQLTASSGDRNEIRHP